MSFSRRLWNYCFESCFHFVYKACGSQQAYICISHCVALCCMSSSFSYQHSKFWIGDSAPSPISVLCVKHALRLVTHLTWTRDFKSLHMVMCQTWKEHIRCSKLAQEEYRCHLLACITSKHTQSIIMIVRKNRFNSHPFVSCTIVISSRRVQRFGRQPESKFDAHLLCYWLISHQKMFFEENPLVCYQGPEG